MHIRALSRGILVCILPHTSACSLHSPYCLPLAHQHLVGGVARRAHQPLLLHVLHGALHLQVGEGRGWAGLGQVREQWGPWDGWSMSWGVARCWQESSLCGMCMVRSTTSRAR